MKNIINIIAIILLTTIFNNQLLAQEKKKKLETKEFKVSGVCNECKTRIENAALIKGVKFAEWDKKKQILKVVYKTDKTNEDAIHKAVAKAGHDTEKVKASQEDYEKLPDCCAYRDGVEIH